MLRENLNRGVAGASVGKIPAVVLCGGVGTRLSAVLQGLPKALAPVAGKPFLDHVLQKLHSAGLRRVLLCIGVHAAALMERYRSGLIDGLEMGFSEEGEPLGTGGALQHAQTAMGGSDATFLLLNGDTFLDINVDEFLGQHLHTAASITLALVKVENESRYATVQVNASGQVINFAGKSAARAGEEAESSFINAGWYLMQREVLQSIPKAPPAVSLECDVLPLWIGKGLYGYVTTGFFIDIGVPEDLLRAQTELAGRSSRAVANPR